MDNKIIIILVGLPARGKSYTSNNLCRFLNWCGILTKVFNCGDYRRNILGGFQDADFFNFNDKENFDKKEEISKLCFNDLLKWIDSKGEIAIFDATNSNQKRRNYLINKSGKYRNNLLFIELITDDDVIIKNNLKLKLQSRDYLDRDKRYALDDFNKRLQFYNNSYETIDENENLKYIKIINFTEKLLINNVIGVNETLVMSYLMNLRLNKHPIYMSRHGQSENNVNMIIGGDPNITKQGEEYAIKLHKFINEDVKFINIIGINAVALLPIAVAYHISHYLTTFLVNVQYFYKVISDPFNNGSNYFGTNDFHVTTSFFNSIETVRLIWLIQAFSIVFGHVVAVLLAHSISEKYLKSKSSILISQFPISIFMICYTFLGLWILSTPTVG